MTRSRAGRVVAIVLVVAWIFAVCVNYYVVHKPFTPESLQALPGLFRGLFASSAAATLAALLNFLSDVFVVVLLVLTAATAGHRLVARYLSGSALETIVVSTGIGLGVAGLVVFGLSAAGVVNVWVYWGLIITVLALLRQDIFALGRQVRALDLSQDSRGEKWLKSFCALALGVTFVLSFAPPWGWDSLQYHLISPKLILENGRLVPPPDNFSLNFPGLVEMLFLAGMVLRGDGTAQALHWIFLPLTLGATLLFAARYFSRRVGWLAAALLCTVPSFLLVATWAYNDMALTFYTFAAFLFAVRARETLAMRDFVLVGVLCGLAMGEKYTAGLVPVALAVLVFHPRRKVLVKTFVMLAAAFAVAAPWLVRNWAFVGNPVYPYGIGGLYWDSFRTAWNTRLGTGLWNEPLPLLIVPWTATIQGMQGVLFDATLGPLLLILLPLNLIPCRAGKPDAPVRAMWYFAGVLYLAWLLGVAESRVVWQTRLLFPAFPLFAILAAVGLEKLAALEFSQFSMRRVAALVVAFVIGLTALSYVLALANDNVLKYILGGMTRDEYLESRLGAHYRIAQWANTQLPRDARIWFLWEPRTYYFQRGAEADAMLDRLPHLEFLYGDADKIAAEGRKEGFTHVLLFREGLNEMLRSQEDPVGEREMKTLLTLEQKHLRLVYGADNLKPRQDTGKLALENADTSPYALYELVP